MGIIESAGGAIMGLALGGINDSRQLRQEEKLQKLNIAGQKEMGLFNKDLALQMWKDTNYGAQRKELEKAGMNAGLLYGMSGGGGTTANVPSGSIGGGHAPQGGNEVGMGIQSALNTAMQKAQIDNLNANTEKTKVDAAKTAGADTGNVIADTAVKTQSLENLKQEVKSNEAKEALTRVQTNIEQVKYQVADATMDDAISDIKWGVRQTIGLANQAEAKGWVDKTTVQTMIERAKAEYSGILLDNMAKEVGIEEVKQKIENLKAQIRQGDTKNAIEAFKAEIQSEYPSLMNTIGKMMNDGLKVLEDLGLHHDKGEKIEK